MKTGTSNKVRDFQGLWRKLLSSNGITKVKDDRFLNDKDSLRTAKTNGYRSGLELAVAQELAKDGIEFLYEPIRIPFVRPPKPSRYTPDIVLPNGIIVELKGRFQTDDRQKHLMIKDQYPNLDIRFVFSNINQRISKTSKTTYAKWCQSKGFIYAKRSIPTAWIQEAPRQETLEALIELMET